MALTASSSRSVVARPSPRCVAAVPRPARGCLRVRATAVQEEVAASTVSEGGKSYFVVMNVFKVKPESYTDFEGVWKSRQSHLKEMPGFVRFAMLKCTNVQGKYISQTYWATKGDFENWTKSSQFQASHSKPAAGSDSKRPNTMTMLEGPPSPELFETVTVTEW